MLLSCITNLTSNPSLVFFPSEFEFPKAYGCFHSTDTRHKNNIWLDIQSISLLVELRDALSPRCFGCVSFSNNNASFVITGPKTVKLFSNKEHMGFSNVSDYPPSDTLELSPNHLVENKPVPLKYVKFQNVRSLTIFIEGNQSESDVTKIHKIALYGTTVDTTNMKDLKKIEEH